MTVQDTQLSTGIQTHEFVSVYIYIYTIYLIRVHTHTHTLLVYFPVFWGTWLRRAASAIRELVLLPTFLRCYPLSHTKTSEYNLEDDVKVPGREF